MTATEEAAHRAIEAVWRIESARLIAGLTRMVRDVGLAEDLAQDALVAALEKWPESGVPDNPGAWLMATAKHRAIDAMRRQARQQEKYEQARHELDDATERAVSDLDESIDDEIGDDLLRLMFIACHPVLATEARVALTLRLLGGLTTDEIARAFLAPEPTIAQRIVRAKKTLAEKRVRFEVPRSAALRDRLASVLEVIYLIFNEGYSASAGDDLVRPGLCEDALRLGRILAGLMPDESEVHGLVALMELQASRLRARVGPNGQPVLLADQNRSRWDYLLVHRGLDALAVAESHTDSPGPYLLQAEIAAVHARARSVDETDWSSIVSLYDALLTVMPSSVVALNRVVAVSYASGPDVALEQLAALEKEPALARYPFRLAVRGDLLLRLGRRDEARAEFERAALLTDNAQTRASLLDRARSCRPAD